MTDFAFACLLEELYDDYCEECKKEGVKPMTPQEWYSKEWM